ncbi:hypothetical protein B7494_g458 [Chlorociboria aeruginascens]|nr:hypothetical protein B7494_g458 [Chlorociboria aeruginascens]
MEPAEQASSRASRQRLEGLFEGFGSSSRQSHVPIDSGSLELAFPIPSSTGYKLVTMDRTNDGIIRWSPNSTRNQFITINLNHRILQVFEAKGHALPDKFEYEKRSKHNDFPPLSACDWSPTIEGLLAVGTPRGDVQLLRVDDDSNAYLTLPLKLQRACQAVAFNTTGLLAVGLDRVRNDSCLQIWDINQRLSGWDSKQPGWNLPSVAIEPKKLEASLSITSVKFFEDQPQTLVIGIKNQSVRIHDLRDPNSIVINFQTRCNNNLAIDYADPNYFASSSLDQPGLMIWDRRVTTRASASPMYLESIDLEEIPWGGALKLERAIETEKNVIIRQLRYCRDQRGTLGILSTAGQLQVFQTKKEYIEPSSLNDIRGSPELLEVKKSHDLEYPYFDQDRRKRFEDRIVSFDWLTLGTSEFQARVVALRANGSFEIMQMPALTASQLYELVPWRPPHRLDDPRNTLMSFGDPMERAKVLGPLYATQAKAEIPVFGNLKLTSPKTASLIAASVQEALQTNTNPLVDLHSKKASNMGDLSSNSIVGEKKLGDILSQVNLDNELEEANGKGKASGSKKTLSSRELHDRSHYSVAGLSPSTESKPDSPDHVMLKRAVDGYLFDCKLNKEIVSSDPWLQTVWDWIASAEQDAKDDGMVSMNVDLSYMGVHSIWMNFLGEKSQARLIDGAAIPDATQWENLIASINSRAGRGDFKGIETSKPQHRQLCLAVASLMKSPTQIDEDLDKLMKKGDYTMAAAWALFEGLPKRAVDILKRGGKDLLFVAMALDIKLKSNTNLDLDNAEWREALDDHPLMTEDFYLRAIYGYITTGDWVSVIDETSLPLRNRVIVALRNLEDDKLTQWLEQQMEEAIQTGDIESIVLTGITDKMADVLTKYIEKFMDYQTPILLMSFCYPRYITDDRCAAWRKSYQDFLQRHKKYILRVKFEQQSTRKSRLRDGTPVIKPPPRQVTIRCLNCDAQSTNDLGNSGATSGSGPSMSTNNPLTASGINAGLACPRCGSRLGRCAICMEIVGVPRSDRPELSNDPAIRRMANFPTFCLKCKHVTHMDHSVAWFSRHVECPVPECRCQCNEMPNQQETSG